MVSIKDEEIQQFLDKLLQNKIRIDPMKSMRRLLLDIIHGPVIKLQPTFMLPATSLAKIPRSIEKRPRSTKGGLNRLSDTRKQNESTTNINSPSNERDLLS